MLKELINIIFRSLRLDKSLYRDARNFSEISIYFALIIMILEGISGAIATSSLIKTNILLSGITAIFSWFIWSLLISSWLPALYLLLPHYYGKGLHKLVAFTQHAGLARDVKDHRLSARDMKLNPILSFLYWKMEYHCVHHMFPTVPAYNLEKLHHYLKDQLPDIKDGLFDTYKEIIPALKKQRDEPDYHLDILLPEQQIP